MPQHKATLVEERAAAAESQRGQARQLSAAVTVVPLEAMAARPEPKPRPAVAASAPAAAVADDDWASF